ncbi:uncharacterized protein LOC108095457 [Drosophila ficusphila]|uniref:uncharacterized protein LOC108095457 n=1 Tax=Drosophila ficusphila TaxID=30025 RepID=UPI0007E6689C|nr:uncharacterized protein LOC108095457 [Drosophila ficusphila]
MDSEEHEEEYTEDETSEAMFFLREHELPMSELLYALKYVRILHGSRSQANQPVVTPMPQVPIVEVEPPAFDWEDKENQPVVRQP